MLSHGLHRRAVHACAIHSAGAPGGIQRTRSADTTIVPTSVGRPARARRLIHFVGIVEPKRRDPAWRSQAGSLRRSRRAARNSPPLMWGGLFRQIVCIAFRAAAGRRDGPWPIGHDAVEPRDARRGSEVVLKWMHKGGAVYAGFIRCQAYFHRAK